MLVSVVTKDIVTIRKKRYETRFVEVLNKIYFSRRNPCRCFERQEPDGDRDPSYRRDEEASCRR